MQILLEQIFSEFQPQGLFLAMEGAPDVMVRGISAVEACSGDDLIFVDKREFVAAAIARRPAAIVTSPGLRASFAGMNLLIAENVGLAHALLKGKYASRDYRKSGWAGIHASAIVHETANLSPGCVVEPKAVIGANSTIGSQTRIMAGCILENDVVVGERCVIHPNAVIGYGTRIGNDVVIEAGSVIGSEGYGFAQDRQRRSYPIPQTGVVVIEDRVRVGANNCIDRAAYAETRIGAGTKMDNLCHVAHNVTIGKDCLLTAMFCVAGSTQIGDRVIASGQTGVIDHAKICNDVVLLHRAGVSKDIDKPGAYAGLPLQPLADYMKNAVAFKSASETRKRLLTVERAVSHAVELKDPEASLF